MQCDPNNLSRLPSCLRCLTDAQLMQVRTYLLCQWFNRLTAVAPNAPSNPDITPLSIATDINLTWTNPTPAGSSNEVWRSTDGITFALFKTVGGGSTTAQDATGLAVGGFYYYKIRSCNGTSCSAFSATISCCNQYTSPNVAAISFPTLIRAFGLLDSFVASGLAALTSVSLPALKVVDGNINITTNANLTTIDLTALRTVGLSLLLGVNKITGVFSLSALTSVGVDFQIQSNTLMTSFSAAALTSVGGNFLLSGDTAMTSFNLSSLANVGSNGGGRFDFNGCTLLASCSFLALTAINGDFLFNNCTALLSASFPVLTMINPNNIFVIDGDACPLTSLSIPVLIITDGFSISFVGDALNAASINQILARGVASGVTASDFELTGGTNAAPSGQGVADKAALILAGNTCNTN